MLKIREFWDLRRFLDDIIRYLSFFICHKNCHKGKIPLASIGQGDFLFLSVYIDF